MQNRNNNTTAHTTWNCKYHIVFAQNLGAKSFTGKNGLKSGQFFASFASGRA